MNSTPVENFSDFLTVQKTLERAKAEGLPITNYALRQWIKTRAFPFTKIERKVIIYWPNLLNFLTCADGTGDTEPHDETNGYGLIRRQN